MRKPLILYSAVTWLAYTIAERYYGNIHYVWCTPCFAPDSPWSRGGRVPPTACPRTIYQSLWDEVQAGDQHSAKIRENKAGILKGASFKEQTGVITPDQREEITYVVDIAQVHEFNPLLFVIPYEGAANLAKEVEVKNRAHPLSFEYLIENLTDDLFDVIEPKGR